MDSTALLGSALWALLRNKLRSLLTVLGITIGIRDGTIRKDEPVADPPRASAVLETLPALDD